MRLGLLVMALAGALSLSGCSHLSARAKGLSNSDRQAVKTSASGNPTTVRVDFATQVRPIFEAKCQPCHFNGGKVYSQMPFDRPETIKRLGPKLFTRIKDENERQVIRAFLAQP